MIDDLFHFTVHKVRLLDNQDVFQRRVSITVNVPQFVYCYQFERKLDENPELLKLAQAELKCALINAIMNGEWKFEE